MSKSNNIFIDSLSKLKHLTYSLVVDTISGGFCLELRQDGKYQAEYSYPVERKVFDCIDEIKYFIKDETITRIILLEHDTDDEIFLYP